jgi:hypothetical protein
MFKGWSAAYYRILRQRRGGDFVPELRQKPGCFNPRLSTLQNALHFVLAIKPDKAGG